jgi:hypothetical protein
MLNHAKRRKDDSLQNTMKSFKLNMLNTVWYITFTKGSVWVAFNESYHVFSSMEKPYLLTLPGTAQTLMYVNSWHASFHQEIPPLPDADHEFFWVIDNGWYHVMYVSPSMVSPK